jgi:hypothetical protein
MKRQMSYHHQDSWDEICLRIPDIGMLYQAYADSVVLFVSVALFVIVDVVRSPCDPIIDSFFLVILQIRNERLHT